MKKNIVGIDLGTSNTQIWTEEASNIVFNEPTLIAWDKKTHNVIEIGYLAHRLVGKVPQDTELFYPVKNGVIANIEATVAFLKRAGENARISKIIKGSKLIFTTPYELTEVERQAYVVVAKYLGAKSLYLVDSLTASAVSCGIDLASTRGNLIVDIGGSNTNVASIALGRIIVAKNIKFAGESIDNAISRYIRTKHHLLVGEKTAEYIKMKIGTLLKDADNNLLEVNGKDLLTGLPHSIIISTSEITDVIIKIFDEIANVIIDTLELSPAEVSSDVIHTGITLTGGGCLLNGAREYFEKKLSIPVHISPFPLESAIQGVQMAYQNFINNPNYSIY